MIKSFRCKETEKIFNRIFSKKLPDDIQRPALKKLMMLNRSVSIDDLRIIMEKIQPIHPGEILNEEFMIPMGISQYKLAKDIKVPSIRISEIVRGKRSITVDTAIRLSIYFGNSAQFWMGLQMDYDLAIAEDILLNKIEHDIVPRAA
jgi:addiction module HigA family antidote